jgi:hypothetical protein
MLYKYELAVFYVLYIVSQDIPEFKHNPVNNLLFKLLITRFIPYSATGYRNMVLGQQFFFCLGN